MTKRLVQLTSLRPHGRRFGLLNGIAIFSNGDLAVVDGDFTTTGVYRIGHTGEVKQRIGKHGLGRYKLKEPVGIFVDASDAVFVADWHNHRIVVYDADLSYREEFGDPVLDQGGSWLARWRSFASYLSYRGSFLVNHFDGEGRRRGVATRSAMDALHGMIYWYRLRGIREGTRRIHSPVMPMRKPNGAAFLPGRVVVSLKNSRNLLVLRQARSRGFIVEAYIDTPTPGRRFGRLGNIAAVGSQIFVCDEEQSVIWQLNPDLSLVRTITGIDSGVGKFAPFSCCEADGLLAVCGGRNIQLFDLDAGQLLHCSDSFGELHGVCYSHAERMLYVADRSEGVILRFALEAL